VGYLLLRKVEKIRDTPTLAEIVLSLVNFCPCLHTKLIKLRYLMKRLTHSYFCLYISPSVYILMGKISVYDNHI